MQATCTTCGGTFEEADLLFGDRGRVCRSCELDGRVEEEEDRDHLALVVGPPALVACGFVAFCVPFVGPVIGCVVSAAAMAGGLLAIQKGLSLRDGGDPTKVNLLLVSGGVSAVLGLGELGLGLVSMALWIAALLM